MSTPRYSKQQLLLAVCVGAVIGYGTASTIPLKQTEGTASAIPLKQIERAGADEVATNTEPNFEQLRKDLSTRFIGDPRTIAEKLGDFLAENPGPYTIALATKTVAGMAENPDMLPNDALQSLYQNQTNPDLKRVLAQVLSLRGDNSLMDKEVDEAKAALESDTPNERQKALIELGKTHYAGAANAIVPLIQDGETSVKLDALLALRATGNESHIHYVENLLNHPDQSVSWLANDVINNLQNLSSRARTKLNSADIAAELPPLPTPGS